MKALINNNGSINYHHWFTFSEGKNKNKKLKVIGTQSDGHGVLESIDTIKNLQTNKTTELKRSLFLQLKPIYKP